MIKPWIGVDLDGTLAKYSHWQGEDVIGAPVPKMLARVKKWLREGITVKIVTARVGPGNNVEKAKESILQWLKMRGLPELEITNGKDFGMIELWDDRVVQVVPNIGMRVDGLWSSKLAALEINKKNALRALKEMSEAAEGLAVVDDASFKCFAEYEKIVNFIKSLPE